MCELFPIARSCCGISVRIALVYIAILSIVTGALINGVLKKAGINIASIEDVKDLHKFGLNHDELAPIERAQKPSQSTVSEDYVNPVVTPEKLESSTASKTPKAGSRSPNPRQAREKPESSDDPKSKLRQQTTIELVGDDGDMATGSADSDVDPDDAGLPTDSPAEFITAPLAGMVPDETTKGIFRATSAQPTTTSVFIRRVGTINRNGMNFLATTFVVLGIFLLVANFLDSTEMGLLYVMLLLATLAGALVLLVGVVGECTRTQKTCMLSKMDWFSGFLVTLFWFIYIVLWVYFASVANAFANGSHRAIY